jgi:Predicted hydrolase (HAD superfamily)
VIPIANFHAYTMEYLHSKIVLFIEASINLEPAFSFFSSNFTIRHGEAEDPLATITVTGDPSLFKDQCIYVGDNLVTDILSCQNINMKGIWLEQKSSQISVSM